jgi:hypothetical protein
MSMSRESLAEKRERLSQEIARQRTELLVAYRGLAKPLRYTQTGIKGLQALKQNAWLIALSPSVVSLAFSFLGWRKKGKPDLFGASSKRESEREAEKIERSFLQKWAGRGWTLFKLYRRFRPFFP